MKELVEEISEEKEMKEQEEAVEKQEEEAVEKQEKIVEKQEEVKTEKEEINKEDKKFKKVKTKSKKDKKALKDMSPEEYKRKKWLIPSIVAIVVVISIFISTIFALVNMNSEKIISGVSISGIDVSGLSKEEATSKMKTIYEEKMQKEIGIQYQEYENTLSSTLMGVNYEVEQAVEEAYLIGKEDNIFINNYNILFTLIGKKNINVNMTLNEDVTKQAIQDIGVGLPGVVIESSYAVEDDELIITKGKEGIVINTEELINKVKDNLNDINSKEDYIEIPVQQKEPEAIDIDKIHEEVHKEVQDAYYTKNPFTVYPEVEGVDFDVEAARELLKEDKEEYVIKLTITKPKVTLDQIGSEAFPDQLSTFTTRYDASDTDRTTNLQIACQKINGKVVLPGETFSYNQTLGPRTAAAGYRNGKIYSGGEVVDGIGGGICQISSTLYNAVLMANLDIVERRNHQFVTSYVPAGRDATVVYGAIDFKFKNARQYPVRIAASAKNGIATVSIYGIKEENEYTFSFNTKTVATIPFSTQYQEDATLGVGTEKVKQKGANGLTTETYMTKMLNGRVVSTTLLSRDTYSAMARIIIRGTSGQTTNSPVDTKPATPENKPESTPIQNPVEPTPSEEKNPDPTTPVQPETNPQPTEGNDN